MTTSAAAAMGSWSPAGSIRGPQGPAGPPGPEGPIGPPGLAAAAAASLAELADVQISSPVDRSLLYFDAATARFRIDPSLTTTSLTDGGNF